MNSNGQKVPSFLFWLLTHTRSCNQLLTLRRGKRKPLSKLWCGTGDWGEVQRARHGREKQGMSERWWGGWHGQALTGLLQGMARRLLIRTRANEVQWHPTHTNALDYLTHNKLFSVLPIFLFYHKEQNDMIFMIWWKTGSGLDMKTSNRKSRAMWGVCCCLPVRSS